MPTALLRLWVGQWVDVRLGGRERARRRLLHLLLLLWLLLHQQLRHVERLGAGRGVLEGQSQRLPHRVFGRRLPVEAVLHARHDGEAVDGVGAQRLEPVQLQHVAAVDVAHKLKRRRLRLNHQVAVRARHLGERLGVRLHVLRRRRTEAVVTLLVVLVAALGRLLVPHRLGGSFQDLAGVGRVVDRVLEPRHKRRAEQLGWWSDARVPLERRLDRGGPLRRPHAARGVALDVEEVRALVGGEVELEVRDPRVERLGQHARERRQRRAVKLGGLVRPLRRQVEHEAAAAPFQRVAESELPNHAHAVGRDARVEGDDQPVAPRLRGRLGPVRRLRLHPCGLRVREVEPVGVAPLEELLLLRLRLALPTEPNHLVERRAVHRVDRLIDRVGAVHVPRDGDEAVGVVAHAAEFDALGRERLQVRLHPRRELDAAKDAEAGCHLLLRTQPPKETETRRTVVADGHVHDGRPVTEPVQRLRAVLVVLLQLLGEGCRDGGELPVERRGGGVVGSVVGKRHVHGQLGR